MYIDMVNSCVVADNGEKFPIMPDELTQLRTFAFRVTQRSVEQGMLALAKRLGLVKEPTPEEQAAAQAAADKAAADAAAASQKEEVRPVASAPEGESNAGSTTVDQTVPPVSARPPADGVSEAPGA
jgi:hypothetical protein